MKILLIIGIVLAVICLLAILILLIPIGIILKYDNDGEIKFRLRVLGITIGGSTGSGSEGAVTKKIKKLLGISEFDSVGTLKGKVSKMGASQTVGQIVDILKGLVSNIGWMLSRCAVNRLHLKIVCAGGDAADTAMEYGTVCAVIYPLIGYINTAVRVKQSGQSINISCDFEQDEAVVEFDILISLRVMYIVGAFFGIIKENAANRVYKSSKKSKGAE